MKTPPAPFWGEEETECDREEGEAFYDQSKDLYVNSRSNLNLQIASEPRGNAKPKMNENSDDVETVIVSLGKRPPGSKIKMKIVYVYDSDEEDGDE